MWDFFLAHANADLDTAETLYDLLAPHEVFLDSRSLNPGEEWDQKLAQAQSNSLITIVLVSSHTEKAYYQREEIAAAINMARQSYNEHYVVPVFLEETGDARRAYIYGLRLKQGISVHKAGGLAKVAQKLKDLLKKTKALSRRKVEEVSTKPIKLELKLQKAITKLNEEDLTSEILAPLIEVLHPGKIEYTHSPIEDRRAIVSFGYDSLRRSHVLCVLPEISRIPSEEVGFGKMMSIAETIRDVGLTKENGTGCFPDEVWLMTCHPFAEVHRKQVAGRLQALSKKNIKFITGEEICSLLIDRLPEVASRLSKYSSPEIINLISALSKHDEGRAFGFSTDRNIGEFYVTTSLAPHAFRAYEAIRDGVSIEDHETNLTIPVRQILNIGDISQSDKAIEDLIKERMVHRVSKGILKKYEVEVGMEISDSVPIIKQKYIDSYLFKVGDFIIPRRLIKKLQDGSDPVSLHINSNLSPNLRQWLDTSYRSDNISVELLRALSGELNQLLNGPCLYTKSRFEDVRVSTDIYDLVQNSPAEELLPALNRRLLDDVYKSEITIGPYTKHEKVLINLIFKLKTTFNQLLKETKNAVNRCPSVLSGNVLKVRRAWETLESIENFIGAVSNDLKIKIHGNSDRHKDQVRDPIRIQVPQPEHLTKLDRIVLVEGVAGCGKTTLLKMLAINILNKDERVFYLPCSSISPKSKNDTLDEIAHKFSRGSFDQNRKSKDGVLIIDGLDEAPFDVSNHILSGYKNFACVVASTRSAFNTKIRSESFRVALSPFNDEERDKFFGKWFSDNPNLIAQANDLIRKYPDIDTHTRLPLIATITVALLQNGIVPKTRAEIYGFRLDLLLSKWDRLRGVSRLQVDNPEAKRRFLRELAYQIHSSTRRLRNINLEELRDVYEKALGEWGYNFSYEKILEDLVVGSGVIIQERQGVYSFGHLTFQEHLAGEYIAEAHSIEQILPLLGRDWWREPLNFYASTKGDITNLISSMMNGVNYMTHAKQLTEMATYAPYTSPGAIDCIRDCMKNYNDELGQRDDS
jgi:energy-coupling factor transporter ATP-binding protein EcfA2